MKILNRVEQERLVKCDRDAWTELVKILNRVEQERLVKCDRDAWTELVSYDYKQSGLTNRP